MMSERMKIDLDNYITGHWGEDQFRNQLDDEIDDCEEAVNNVMDELTDDDRETAENLLDAAIDEGRL